MPDRVFLDTNILIYAYSKDEIAKQNVANSMLEVHGENIVISKQVVNELVNVLLKKFKLSSAAIENAILELDTFFPIADFDLKTQIKALHLKERYNFQYYDALIVATALENGCTILLSEDMQHQQIIESTLTIINPFK